MWNSQTPEWFEEERNPNNCAIRCIEGHKDVGYIFDGFPERSPPRDTSNLTASPNLEKQRGNLEQMMAEK